jgi:hypothetical protein
MMVMMLVVRAAGNVHQRASVRGGATRCQTREAGQTVRLTVPRYNRGAMTDDELKALFDGLRQDNAVAHAETRRLLREENADAHAETRRLLREENADAHAETRRLLREENADAHAETRRLLREENADAHAETRRLFVVTVERIDSRVDLLAEGLADTRQLLAREMSAIREEMRKGFAETQAMIKAHTRSSTAA